MAMTMGMCSSGRYFFAVCFKIFLKQRYLASSHTQALQYSMVAAQTHSFCHSLDDDKRNYICVILQCLSLQGFCPTY